MLLSSATFPDRLPLRYPTATTTFMTKSVLNTSVWDAVEGSLAPQTSVFLKIATNKFQVVTPWKCTMASMIPPRLNSWTLVFLVTPPVLAAQKEPSPYYFLRSMVMEFRFWDLSILNKILPSNRILLPMKFHFNACLPSKCSSNSTRRLWWTPFRSSAVSFSMIFPKINQLIWIRPLL